jgi:hypothetical protein
MILLRTRDGYVNLSAAVRFEVAPVYPEPTSTPSVEEFLASGPELEPPSHWTVYAVFTGSDVHEDFVEIPSLRADSAPGAWAQLDEFAGAVLHARIHQHDDPGVPGWRPGDPIPAHAFVPGGTDDEHCAFMLLRHAPGRNEGIICDGTADGEPAHRSVR